MKTLQNVEFEQVFLDKWSHAKNKDNARPNGLIHVASLSYTFMDAFSNKRLLFLLTLVVLIISYMLIWLKG